MGKTQKKKTKRETYVFRSDDNIKIDHNSLGFEELEDVHWHDFENPILNFGVSEETDRSCEN
jgi:hypothetical protein